MKNLTPREYFFSVASVVTAMMMFGTTFPVNKYVLTGGVSPASLALYRMVIVCLCLLPFYKRYQGDTRWNASDWRRVAFVGGIAYTSGMALEYIGTLYTTASNVSLIVSTEAIFATFLSVVILKEKLHFTTVIGGFFAVIGMGLVMFKDLLSFELHLGEQLKGDLITLSSVLAWGLYTVFSKKVLDGANPIYSIFFFSLFSCGSLSVLALSTGTILDFLHMDLYDWLGTVFLGVIGSCAGMVLYFEGLRKLPTSFVVLNLTLLPVFGVFFSMILLDERLTLIQWIGAVIIIASVGYVLKPRKKEHLVVEDALPGV